MRAKRHLEPPLGRSQAIYSLTGMAMPPVTKGPRVFEETTLQMATAWLCSVSHPCSAVVGMTEEVIIPPLQVCMFLRKRRLTPRLSRARGLSAHTPADGPRSFKQQV